MVTLWMPAASAAFSVSSRATASNDAGIVTRTSWSANGRSGCSYSHAWRRWRRYAAEASTGEIFVTPSAAFHGRIAAVRSAAVYESQLFAEETRRDETSAPRRCAKRPTIHGGAESHGSAVAPAANSFSPGI